MKEYYEKAIIGFDASRFFESQYCGKEYLTIISNGFFSLFSREKISENSQTYRNGFVTKLRIEELENVYSSKLFGLHNGNYYEIQLVSKNLESIELLARREFLAEDKQNGFIDARNERVTHKIVTLADLKDIQAQKTSVYQELYEKYSQEKKKMTI